MNLRRLGGVVLLVVGCGGFLGMAGRMRDTTVASVPQNYDKLEAEATKVGWKTLRGSGTHKTVDDWDLTVWPAEGQKIAFTKNNRTEQISFACDGGPLNDKDTCESTVNRLLAPAFGGVYK